MKITCSILCYNYGRYLPQAIESCLNQQQGAYELEVLVIDDGSTDETSTVCQHYQGRVRVLRSENKGFGASLDKAIYAASGEYICLLDADDYFANEKIITLIPEIKKGFLYIENPKHHITQEGKPINYKLYEGGSTSTLCLNRNAALSLLPAQNEIFFHPLKSAGHGVKVKKPLTYYRFHDSNMTDFKKSGCWNHHLAKVKHILAEQLLVMTQKPPTWVESELLKKISRSYRAEAYYNELEAALELGEWRDALLSCSRMLLTASRSESGISKLQYKMIVKTLLCRPSFPKKDRKTLSFFK